jgi:hypothetical protein
MFVHLHKHEFRGAAGLASIGVTTGGIPGYPGTHPAAVALPVRRSWPGDRGVRRKSGVEEGPGSTGQGGGQHPPGVTRGTVPQRTDRLPRPRSREVRVKRWCKRPPAAGATRPARQTPPGARSNSVRPRAARPSTRVDRRRPPATVVVDGWSPPGRPRGRPETEPGLQASSSASTADLRQRDQHTVAVLISSPRRSSLGPPRPDQREVLVD